MASVYIAICTYICTYLVDSNWNGHTDLHKQGGQQNRTYSRVGAFSGVEVYIRKEHTILARNTVARMGADDVNTLMKQDRNSNILTYCWSGGELCINR